MQVVNKEEKQEAFHKITRRHIARILTVLEGFGASNGMVSSVKSEMWDMHNDLIASFESNEGDVYNGMDKD